MSDSYQAIYDAVANENIGHYVRMALEAVSIAGYEHQRPSAVYRPKLYPDGNQWCALYGENLQEGCAGFGDTPALAMTQFDVEWLNCKCGPARTAPAAA